jgi:hypothetical protein
MTWRIVVAAALSSAFLGGCASSGNESIADASQQTVSGQLVKEELPKRKCANCTAIL